MEEKEITMYSTGCPKCNILKKKLDENGVAYSIESDVDKMQALGLTELPALSVDGQMLNFNGAITWLASR